MRAKHGALQVPKAGKWLLPVKLLVVLTSATKYFSLKVAVTKSGD